MGFSSHLGQTKSSVFSSEQKPSDRAPAELTATASAFAAGAEHAGLSPMTDQQARQILEQNAARYRKISDEIVKNNARAEQGQANLSALLIKAKELFGTDDIEEIRRIHAQRMMRNAQKVRAHLDNLDLVERELEKLKKSAQPTR